eukprot:SAG22_NODE_6715_length_820_cov_1.762829_1_plen_159_part_10
MPPSAPNGFYFFTPPVGREAIPVKTVVQLQAHAAEISADTMINRVNVDSVWTPITSVPDFAVLYAGTKEEAAVSEPERAAAAAGGGRERVGEDESAATRVHASRCTRMRGELEGLKLSQLKKRAIADGISQAEIDDADDSDDPFAHMAELVVNAAAVKA